MPTQQLAESRLNKVRGLAAFSPDALSSIAYANQEIYLGLVIAGSAGLALAFPMGAVITAVLTIVAISYFQTLQTYPTGGGSYSVARENLGAIPGLIAGGALLIDYLLTAAVSLTAATEALASAFPVLWTHRIHIAVGFLLILTVANLRGLREAGTLMAVPVYLFLFTYLTMIVYGVFNLFIHGPKPLDILAPNPVQPLSWLLVIKAFSTGCTALTGIEAISNGVPAFKSPEAKNAGKTLIVMTILMGILFLGSIGLTSYLAIIAGPHETILSALARQLLGTGPAYYLIQISTMLILAVAANTSFAGFPRLTAVLAQDSYLPHQFTNLGDRLVYTNGILILAAATGLLIVLFNGDTHRLIPLFAVGVFLAFTLSQTGMVIHWLKFRQPGWKLKLAINAIGAVTTATTFIVVGYSKFSEGAWITIILIPAIVLLFSQIHHHYQLVQQQLSLKGLPPSIRPFPPPRVVVPISGVHRGIVDAVDFATAISKNVTAVYIELEPGSGAKVRETWNRWWPGIPIVIRPSPYRSIIGPLIEFLDEVDREHNDGQLAAVVLPEFIPAKWWQGLLHNQTTWLVKTALLYRRRNHGFQRVIIDVPYHLRK